MRVVPRRVGMFRLRKPFYGWIIVGAAAFISFMEVGEFNPVLSVFLKPMAEEFGWNRAMLSGAVTIGALGGGLVSPLVGPILDRYGPRFVIVFSGAFMGVTLVAMSLIQELWQFYLFYGLGRSIVAGVVMLAVIVVVSNWFVRRRAIAMAATTVGTRVGMASLPLMVQMIMSIANWRTAWITLGFGMLLFMALPSFIFLRRRPEDVGMLPDGEENPSLSSGAGSAIKVNSSVAEVSWTLKEAIKTPALWLTTMAISQAFLVGGGINLHLIPHFTDRGLSEGAAVGAISLFAVAAGIGSVLGSLLAQRIHIRLVIGGSLGLSALTMILFAAVSDAPMAFISAGAYGLVFGSMINLASVIHADYFGRGSLGAIRGFVSPLLLAANSVGPLLAGMIYDSSGSYTMAFTLYGISLVLAALCMVLAVPPRSPARIVATQ